MSEIEKMYENAGIEPEYIEGENLMEYSYGTLKYPPFTAEKQIELIKWLVCTGEEESTFEETLSKQVNDLWQDLTEEEKQQVKGILE